MPTRKQKRQQKKERIKILGEIDILLNVCKTCEKWNGGLDRSNAICKKCPTHKKLNESSKRLEGIKNNEELKPKVAPGEPTPKRFEFTEKEDRLIINTIKAKGVYRGFYTDLGLKLGRGAGTIRNRIKLLTERGHFDELQ